MHMKLSLMELILFISCLAVQLFINVSGSLSITYTFFANLDTTHQFVENVNTTLLEEGKDRAMLITQIEFLPSNSADPIEFTIISGTIPILINNQKTTLNISKLNHETCKPIITNIPSTDGSTVVYTTVYITASDNSDNRPVCYNIENSTDLNEDMMSETSVGCRLHFLVYNLNGGGGTVALQPFDGSPGIDDMGIWYNFTIFANHQVQEPPASEITFTVVVDDLNNYVLKFPLSKHEVSILVNKTIGSTSLTMSDLQVDSRTNVSLSYKIDDQQSSTSPDVFANNYITGQIGLLQSLNFDKTKHFHITLQVSDEAFPELTSMTTIGINVLDVTERCPEFSQSVYNVSVQENLPNGGVICILNVSYKGEEGLANIYFTVNNTMFSVENNGAMYLDNGVLDRESTPEIVIEVWAFDVESDRLNCSALVIINLLDVNDNNPEFDNKPIIFNLPEGDYLPATVGEVFVTDLDAGLNGQVMIYSPSQEESFVVLQNGTILVRGVLDREKKEKYVIPLIASDLGDPPRKNFADAVIVIQDVNDNAPTFSQDEYFAHIVLSNMIEGDPVITVPVTDLDTGNNSQVCYRFQQDYNDFTINGETGQISLSSNISADFTDRSFALVVIATDFGDPPLSSSVTVFVTMVVNDTSFGLQFVNSHYNFTIPEEQPVAAEVGTVRAVTGNASISVMYFLKTYTDIFSVTNKGHIITHVVLDRENHDSYNILVRATDSREPPNTSATVVTVSVSDINDNNPLFSPLIHTNLTCQENMDFIDIGLITATDMDTGDNGCVTYSLENDFNSTFHINSSTGELTIIKSLDRETKDSFDVKVVATDLGIPPLSSTIIIHITVEDVNDNPPIFKEESNVISVKENEPPQVILNIPAMDKDIGNNARISYSLANTSPLFYIGCESGSISTLQPLDYETDTQHLLKVVAVNPSDPQLQSTATVTVNVEDVNEETPTFQYPVYNRIIEDSAYSPGLLLFDINASDETDDHDKGVHYAISDGNSEGLFVISNSTGHIIPINDLPRHNVPLHYILTVRATDLGVPPLSAYVKVYITIAPNNMSFPVFSADTYMPDPINVQALPSTFLVQIFAHYSTPVIYNITSGNEKGYFSLDPLTGVIRTKKALKEKDFPIDLTVMAVNPTRPDIFSEAKVHVTVKDDKNFTLVFPNVLVEVKFKEEQASPSLIIQQKAFEKSGKNPLITYTILNGDSEYFSVKATNGKVYAETTFDFEEGPTEYRVVLSAEVHGFPAMKKAYCTIVIYIVDINDCEPEFEPMGNMVVEENAPRGTLVGKVTAIDRDSGENAFILYSLLGDDDLFEIDGLFGNIFVKEPPDYESQKSSVLKITATNNKTSPFYQASTQVTVEILDVNDNTPEITPNQYFAELSVNSPDGTFVVHVNAEDRDQGQNGVIEYFILPDSTASECFLVENVRNGTIITTGSHMETGLVNLTVLARDRGSPPLNSTAIVLVNVIDKQTSPEFSPNEISTTVKKQKGIRKPIYTFKANNAAGKNLTYIIVAGNEHGLFTLDGQTGQLRTTSKFSDDTQLTYNVTVEAVEIPQLLDPLPKNIAHLEIFVQRVNEGPKFENRLYKAEIVNSVPSKFPVTRVAARYSGENQPLIYRLVNQSGTEFAINKYTGQIVVVSVTGKTGTFQFKVQVTDQAGLSDITVVQVVVSSSSSSQDIVRIQINQTLDMIESKLPNIIRLLEDTLQRKITVLNVISNATNNLKNNKRETTSIEFQALDKDNGVVDSKEVVRKLTDSLPSVQKSLDSILGRPVDISASEAVKPFLSQGAISGIAMGALLACIVLGSAVYLWKRNKPHDGASEKSNMLSKAIEYMHTNGDDGDPGETRDQKLEITAARNAIANSSEEQVMEENQGHVALDNRKTDTNTNTETMESSQKQMRDSILEADKSHMKANEVSTETTPENALSIDQATAKTQAGSMDQKSPAEESRVKKHAISDEETSEKELTKDQVTTEAQVHMGQNTRGGERKRDTLVEKAAEKDPKHEVATETQVQVEQESPAGRRHVRKRDISEEEKPEEFSKDEMTTKTQVHMDQKIPADERKRDLSDEKSAEKDHKYGETTEKQVQVEHEIPEGQSDVQKREPSFVKSAEKTFSKAQVTAETQVHMDQKIPTDQSDVQKDNIKETTEKESLNGQMIAGTQVHVDEKISAEESDVVKQDISAEKTRQNVFSSDPVTQVHVTQTIPAEESFAQISDPCVVPAVSHPELEDQKGKERNPEVVQETEVEFVETWESYESNESETTSAETERSNRDTYKKSSAATTDIEDEE